MQGEAQVMVTVLKQQWFGLLHKVAAQGPLQLQHLLWVRAGATGRGSPSYLADGPFPTASLRAETGLGRGNQAVTLQAETHPGTGLGIW